MRGSFILSIILHVAIIAIIWLGPPTFSDPMVDPVQVIDVAVVTEVRQRPDDVVPQKPEPEQKPKKAPPEPPKPLETASLPKPPPPPTPPPTPPAPPEPAAKPEPKEEVAPKPTREPVAVPIPKETPQPKPKPQPQPEEVAQPEPVLAPQPRRKPKPPEDFAQVLKDLEKKLAQRPKPDPKPKKDDEPTFEEQLSDVLNKHARLEKPTQPAPLGPKMSMSEIDALRRQIERCWNPPAGAPEAENLVVEVKLTINPDGTVRQTRIVDAARMSRDPFYRAAAESVRRAIKSPLCTPLNLPLDKYELWKDTTLRFDPRELVGR